MECGRSRIYDVPYIRWPEGRGPPSDSVVFTGLPVDEVTTLLKTMVTQNPDIPSIPHTHTPAAAEAAAEAAVPAEVPAEAAVATPVSAITLTSLFNIILFGGKQATLTLCHLAGLQTTH